MSKNKANPLAAFDAGLSQDDHELAVTQLVKNKKESQEREKFVAQFLDGQPFDETRCWNEYDFYYQNSAAAYIEAGKRLVVLKHMIDHGEFLNALSERNVNPRTAQAQMAVAIKFANTQTSTLLNRSKLIELTQLSDEEIKSLNDQGAVLGKSLDELETMSVRELQELVRKSKAKIEKKEAELEKMRKENERLADHATERDDAKAAVKIDATVEWIRLNRAFDDFLRAIRNTPDAELDKMRHTYAQSLIAYFNDTMKEIQVEMHTTVVHLAPWEHRQKTEFEKIESEPIGE